MTEAAPIALLDGVAAQITARWPDDPRTPDLAGRLGPLAARLSSAGTKRTVVHGDFWAGNLLISHGTVTGVVDWAAAELSGEPLRDVVRFALSYSLYLDRHTRPGRPVPGHPGLRADGWGAGIRYALSGQGWYGQLVRGFVESALVRLGGPAGLVACRAAGRARRDRGHRRSRGLRHPAPRPAHAADSARLRYDPGGARPRGDAGPRDHGQPPASAAREAAAARSGHAVKAAGERPGQHGQGGHGPGHLGHAHAPPGRPRQHRARRPVPRPGHPGHGPVVREPQPRHAISLHVPGRPVDPGRGAGEHGRLFARVHQRRRRPGLPDPGRVPAGLVHRDRQRGPRSRVAAQHQPRLGDQRHLLGRDS